MNNPYKRRISLMLVELIIIISFSLTVVAVSVPRYAGAMDKARDTTDNQYATLVANAAIILLADGTFESGGSIEIAHDGSLTSTGVAIKGFDAGEIYKIVSQKKLDTSGQIYTIILSADGSYIIDIQ